jgi:hypothetical protein
MLDVCQYLFFIIINYFFCLLDWGRVGESGQNNLDSCGKDVNAAIKGFEKVKKRTKYIKCIQ